jgi:dehydratase family protein
MLELRDMPHQNVLTVTGKTLGENLDDIAASPTYFAERRGYLNNVKVARDEIIQPREDPFGTDGGVAVLYGNLAPGGCMVKAFSVPREMHVHTGPARVFEFEEEAVRALVARQVKPGDVLVIRYEGPRANGMPEMYYAAAILFADPALNTTTAIVTDGRYSGAMRGPCIGHVAPEAIDRGPSRWSPTATSSRSTCRSGGWRSWAWPASTGRPGRSRRSWRTARASGSRCGRGTTAGSSRCTRASPAAPQRGPPLPDCKPRSRHPAQRGSSARRQVRAT